MISFLSGRRRAANSTLTLSESAECVDFLSNVTRRPTTLFPVTVLYGWQTLMELLGKTGETQWRKAIGPKFPISVFLLHITSEGSESCFREDGSQLHLSLFVSFPLTSLLGRKRWFLRSPRKGKCCDSHTRSLYLSKKRCRGSGSEKTGCLVFRLWPKGRHLFFWKNRNLKTNTFWHNKF